MDDCPEYCEWIAEDGLVGRTGDAQHGFQRWLSGEPEAPQWRQLFHSVLVPQQQNDAGDIITEIVESGGGQDVYLDDGRICAYHIEAISRRCVTSHSREMDFHDVGNTFLDDLYMHIQAYQRRDPQYIETINPEPGMSYATRVPSSLNYLVRPTEDHRNDHVRAAITKALEKTQDAAYNALSVAPQDREIIAIGATTPGSGPVISLLEVPRTSGCYAPIITDENGDGDSDIAVATPMVGTIEQGRFVPSRTVFCGDGKGHFSALRCDRPHDKRPPHARIRHRDTP